MSFSSEIKDKMILAFPNEKCCRRALLLGFLTARADTEYGVVYIDIDGENVVKPLISLIREAYGKEPETEKRSYCKNGYRIHFLSSAGSAYLVKLNEDKEIDISKVCKCASCRFAFAKGIFLASGTVNSPSKDFYLSLTPNQSRIDAIIDFFDKCDIEFKISQRNGKRFLYLKDGNAIADFFALCGCNDTTFVLLNSKIEKQVRSDSNRLRNCETNNIQKSINANAQTIELINMLYETDKFSALPDELKPIAKARTENPELSLSELARIITPAVSKSGLYHRLERINEFAKKIIIEK